MPLHLIYLKHFYNKYLHGGPLKESEDDTLFCGGGKLLLFNIDLSGGGKYS